MSSLADPTAIGGMPSAYLSSAIPEEDVLGTELKWYAVYTRPRHEKSVDQHCRTRAIDSFCPVYKVSRRWSDGSKVVLDLPLFPGYLFVRIPVIARSTVLKVPGVLTIVSGTDKKMAALPDEEMTLLQQGLAQRRAEPHSLLTMGQRVRIRSGALAGMDGIVTRTKGLSRVVMTLDLIMKSVAVEVDEREVEMLPPIPPFANQLAEPYGASKRLLDCRALAL